MWSFLVPSINGILTFSKRLMIGRWIALPHSSFWCIPFEWDGEMMKDFVGFLTREGCLMLDLTIRFLFSMISLISIGGVFGRIMLMWDRKCCLEYYFQQCRAGLGYGWKGGRSLCLLESAGGRFQLDAIWKMILPCLMWCLWRERNGCNFEDHERTLVKLRDFFFFKTLFLGWGLRLQFFEFSCFFPLLARLLSCILYA